MSQETLLDKLHLSEEKNLLIQGLPSSIEKQFAKLSFAKNVTPLLKSRRIDWALVFAVNHSQLNSILKDVIPAMHEKGKLWVAYPKLTSKIASDLNRNTSWNSLSDNGYEGIHQIALDHMWNAQRFCKGNVELEKGKMKAAAERGKVLNAPADLQKILNKNKLALEQFDGLEFEEKKSFVNWIGAAKKEESRAKRIEQAVEKLAAGKISPMEK
jgi:hypothetical protein